MAHYCVSDIHGEYEKYKKMLDLIRFSDSDILYVLGDVVDRGPDGIKVLQDMMRRQNVVPLVGNHEYMALAYLLSLSKNESGVSAMIERDRLKMNCEINGGMPTIDAYNKLTYYEQRELIDYLREFITYEEVTVGGKAYVLVHAGLGHFSPDRPLCEYRIDELIQCIPDYDRMYFKDRYLVTGHTPTQLIPGNEKPGRIYMANHHIAIDCGAAFGGKLGALCLETGEEFYA